MAGKTISYASLNTAQWRDAMSAMSVDGNDHRQGRNIKFCCEDYWPTSPVSILWLTCLVG